MSSKTVFSCDRCRTEIMEWNVSKSLASRGTAIAFFAWTDDGSTTPNILHFCSDECAKNYLANWLLEQRHEVVDAEFMEVDEPPAPEKAKSVASDDDPPNRRTVF
jgi:hypothetical protein